MSDASYKTYPHRCQFCRQPIIPSQNLYTGVGWAHLNGCPDRAPWRDKYLTSFVSESMSIARTFWRLVVYEHPQWGSCTDYEWFDESRYHWAKANEWPSYDGNDTYDGLPRSLVKLYNKYQEATQ